MTATDIAHPDDSLLNEIKAIVGASGWRKAADAARYFEDPRGRFEGRASLIVMPGSTAQVAELVKLCNTAKVAIIPFSGGTGVVAGQMSVDSENVIILSLEKMNRVREISVDDGVMTAEAGCILENVHAAALEHDLMFPLSMASKGSCCIGGNLATNAGGIQVLRYGNARDLCLGIEAVMPDGEILSELSPLRKNNTGYDLRNLLIGSEGTLGIITAATLILKPVDPETVTVLCAVPSPAGAVELYKHLRRDLGESIAALELMSGFGLGLVATHFPSLTTPFDVPHDWFLLMEVTGRVGISEQVEASLGEALESELLQDAVFAQSETQRAALWDLRENTPEANRMTGTICNSDTSVPISQVNQFINLTTAALAAINPDLRLNTYGHIGDGNIHVNVFPPEGAAKPAFVAANPEIIEQVRMAINETTVQCNGSISAEHGIGRLKTQDLEQYGSTTKLAALRRIKSAFDPNNIMNPGALLR